MLRFTSSAAFSLSRRKGPVSTVSVRAAVESMTRTVSCRPRTLGDHSKACQVKVSFCSLSYSNNDERDRELVMPSSAQPTITERRDYFGETSRAVSNAYYQSIAATTATATFFEDYDEYELYHLPCESTKDDYGVVPSNNSEEQDYSGSHN